jgi:hypothetical protein
MLVFERNAVIAQNQQALLAPPAILDQTENATTSKRVQNCKFHWLEHSIPRRILQNTQCLSTVTQPRSRTKSIVSSLNTFCETQLRSRAERSWFEGVGRERHTALWKPPCPSGLFHQQFYQVSLDVGVRQSMEKVPVQSLKRLLGEGRQILILNDNVSLEQLIVPNASTLKKYPHVDTSSRTTLIDLRNFEPGSPLTTSVPIKEFAGNAFLP